MRVVKRLEDAPGCPEGLLPEVSEWWEAFWLSPVAEATYSSTDLPALERLAGLYDLRERARRSVAEHMMVEGSKGQSVLNPLIRAMAPWDTEIRNLEDRFGLNPKARIQLGVQLGQARKTLDDLMAPTKTPETEPDVDPRDVINL
jgi:P27 family predicted phage terminase small subunit